MELSNKKIFYAIFTFWMDRFWQSDESQFKWLSFFCSESWHGMNARQISWYHMKTVFCSSSLQNVGFWNHQKLLFVNGLCGRPQVDSKSCKPSLSFTKSRKVSCILKSMKLLREVTILTSLISCYIFTTFKQRQNKNKHSEDHWNMFYCLSKI